jgi:hypothetical protein
MAEGADDTRDQRRGGEGELVEQPHRRAAQAELHHWGPKTGSRWTPVMVS